MSNWEDSILKIKDDNVQWRLDFTKYLKTSTQYNGYRFFWELIPMIYFVTGKKDIAYTDKNCNIFLNIPHRKVDLENEKWEFIYYHECLHQLYETFEVEKALIQEEGKDFSHYILNIASDCIINHYLKHVCNLEYPTKSIITPEYLEKKYKIVYNPKDDNQYDMYKKLYAIRDQLKSDAIIQQALEGMPDVDLDVEGGDGKMPKIKKIPSTADWKLGSKEARHVANNILVKYCDKAKRLPNGKLSKEEAIRVMSEAAAEIQKTLLGKPVKPAAASNESFSYRVMSSAEFVMEADAAAAMSAAGYSTFEQGWDYAISDVLAKIQNTILQYSMAGGPKGPQGGPKGPQGGPKGPQGGSDDDDDDDDDEEVEVPENDPTEESPFLPKANNTDDGSLSEPGAGDGDGDSDDEPDSDSDIDDMDADDAADSAKKSADSAQRSANAAKKASDKAQDKADDAAAKDSDSSKDLDKAAKKAQDAAKKAQDAADKAKQAADKAQQAASNGNDEEAKKQAKDAAHAANEAKKQAQQAGVSPDSDSDINDMDANEAADSAQDSADAARQYADEARQSADEAQEKADNALDNDAINNVDGSNSVSKRDLENAARKAKQAADKAQQDADKAQDAADNAKAAAANGNTAEAKRQAKAAADAANDARKQAQKAEENNIDETGMDSSSGSGNNNNTKISGKLKKAKNTGKTVDWDPNQRDDETRTYGKSTPKSWRTFADEIHTYATKNKFGDMNAKDVKTIIKRMTNGLDSSLDGFVKKCKQSKELQRGIIVKTVMEKKNASWSQQFSNIIKKTVRQRVNKKINEWRKTYHRPNRRQGIYQEGDPLKKGKIREKDRLTVSLAYYVDISGSMRYDHNEVEVGQKFVRNIFKYIYTLNRGLKKQYAGNTVVEECLFKIIAFDYGYTEITPENIPEAKNGGTDSLLNIVRKMKSLSQTYMINVVITDGGMDFDLPAIKSELEDFAGNVVFITNDANLVTRLKPLTNMGGGVCGKKFELIIVPQDFNIDPNDFLNAQ